MKSTATARKASKKATATKSAAKKPAGKKKITIEVNSSVLEEFATETREGEYNGFPTIEFVDERNPRYSFSFGMKKAKVVLANLQALVDFVEG